MDHAQENASYVFCSFSCHRVENLSLQMGFVLSIFSPKLHYLFIVRFPAPIA